VTVTVTGTVTAELPWSFLRALCSCAPEECKAMLVVAGGEGGGEPASLPGELQGKLPGALPGKLPGKLPGALQYAACLLQETASSGIHVSASPPVH
jgi:hypothetical protein